MEWYDEAAAKKAGKSMAQLLTGGFLAGLFIAFGALCSQIALSQTGQRLASAAVFPIGLVMVVLTGAELFTGNCLMAGPVMRKKLTVRMMLRNWIPVYLGNLAGSLALAAAVYVSGTWNSTETLGSVMTSAANGKVSLDITSMIVRGILCNILVCIAVWNATKAENTTGKILAAYLPTFAFVLCGFEHSVANMYFIPMGMALSGPEISMSGFLVNLLFVTVGNILGGAVITAGALCILNRKG